MLFLALVVREETTPKSEKMHVNAVAYLSFPQNDIISFLTMNTRDNRKKLRFIAKGLVLGTDFCVTKK